MRIHEVNDTVMCDECGQEKSDCTSYEANYNILTLCKECDPMKE